MTIEPKTYASEAGHWYTSTGEPAHEQPNKSKPGEFRPTTLRDARKLGLYPSVSGILKIQAKPGLNYWVKEQVAKAAWETPYRYEEKEWISNVLINAEENMSRARDLGSEIHGAIERYLRSAEEHDWEEASPESPHWLAVNAAVAALKDLGVWGQPFRAERAFASPLGWGGCADLVTDGFIGDFKAINTLDKKYDWPERAAQIAAYQMGIHGRLCRGVNILISTEKPGEYAIKNWSESELEHGWNLFMASFQLWMVSNQYNPLVDKPDRSDYTR